MREFLHCRMVIVLTVFLFACSPDPADESESLTTCTDCVELIEFASLSFAEAPTLPSPSGLLASHPNSGHFAFVDRMIPYEILLFDSAGSFQAVLGGEGDGPGEYRRITGIAFDSNDRLWVFSRRGLRADLYDEDFTWARSLPLTESVEKVAPLEGGRFAAVTSSRQGPAVKVLDRDGGFSQTGVELPAESMASLVSIASDWHERFWVSFPHEYSIIEGGPGGSAEALPVSEPGWFSEDYSEEVKTELSQVMDTQGSTVLAINYDPALDALWVFTGVPSGDLEVGVVRDAFERQDPAAMESLPALLVDHVIEGLRLSDGTTMASGRFDYLSVALDSPLQYRIRADTVIQVVRVRVR